MTHSFLESTIFKILPCLWNFQEGQKQAISRFSTDVTYLSEICFLKFALKDVVNKKQASRLNIANVILLRERNILLDLNLTDFPISYKHIFQLFWLQFSNGRQISANSLPFTKKKIWKKIQWFYWSTIIERTLIRQEQKCMHNVKMLHISNGENWITHIFFILLSIASHICVSSWKLRTSRKVTWLKKTLISRAFVIFHLTGLGSWI